MGDGGRRARATAGRGKGECRRERRGRVAAGDGVGPDGVGDGGRRGLRIADTHLPSTCQGRSERRLSILEGPVREPRLVLAAGDAVCTGKGCRQEVRRGAGRGVAGAKSARVTRGCAIRYQRAATRVQELMWGWRGGGRQWHTYQGRLPNP